MNKHLIKQFLLLLLIPISVNAITIIEFSGNPEIGWTFRTNEFDYYAFWLQDELACMWIYTDNPVANCLIIGKGEEKKCSIEEFSIILYHFPFPI